MDNQVKDKLDNIFYNNDFMMKNFNVFKNKVKDVPKDVLKFYYDNQEVVQMFKPIVKRSNRKFIPITTTSPFMRVYFDTMYLTSHNLIFINAVDLFSKYGFSHVFRGNSVSSSKATDFLRKVIKEVLKLGYYISSIKADDGSEFKGSFKKECDNLLIELSYTDPNDKNQTSPIESFNRGIRLSL